MAGYQGHINGAFFFGLIYLSGIAYVFFLDNTFSRYEPFELIISAIALGGLCLLFGLWPDVDINSKGQNIFYSIFFVTDVILIVTQHFQEAAYLGLFALLPILSKHRGWTHTYWAMFLIPSPLAILPFFFYPEKPLIGLPFYGAAVVGYFSHLFMDGLVISSKRKKKRR